MGEYITEVLKDIVPDSNGYSVIYSARFSNGKRKLLEYDEVTERYYYTQEDGTNVYVSLKGENK